MMNRKEVRELAYKNGRMRIESGRGPTQLINIPSGVPEKHIKVYTECYLHAQFQADLAR
jgi:hypothetical protein